MGLKLPTYVGIGILLLAILLVSVSYGCCNTVMENFETVSTDPPTPQLMQKIEESVISQLATEKTKDSVATVETVNSVLKQLEAKKQGTLEGKSTVMQPVETPTQAVVNPVVTAPLPKQPAPIPLVTTPTPPPAPAPKVPPVTVTPAVNEQSSAQSEETKSIADKLLAQKEESDTLDKDEQELFDQITKNTIPAEDLDKLIRAGVLTENMVEKFLNRINRLNEEKIEGFCSGKDCYAKV